MKSIATLVSTLAFSGNCLEIGAQTEAQLLPPWDFSIYPYYYELTQ